MTMTREQTFSVAIAEGVFVDVSIQLKASAPVVPKPRPNPRRLAELVLDIGDPSSEAAPVQANFKIDLKYQP
ncbi:hypothetical protein MNQ95_08475 [Pseudoxanthomonas daejeonensis]|uniref:Uncharacterized protein n=1 Tax=Pseudoxanthomonas daejeonensis TaxID=266062 RepID=A0ABQ6Z7M9_9GAMM|nr:hypothetical protein [Pseudoxanthomonas daejeonensis]KAF1695016.1 hypothetical protein CSC65_07300 [Pseudoxanthomonas daejeonensis]UNK56213.1 hypothetical protein MNQ95_08475 [Pseudoxanthomonas daejeonensis]